MLVWNMRGASDVKCSCGSWIVHWAKFGGQTTLAVCSANGCFQVATVGAQVAANGKAVIIPMCDLHNQQDQAIDVFDYSFAVSADIARTCGKRSLAELGFDALAEIPPHRFQASAKVAGFLAGLTVHAEPASVEHAAEDAKVHPVPVVGRIKRRIRW